MSPFFTIILISLQPLSGVLNINTPRQVLQSLESKPSSKSSCEQPSGFIVNIIAKFAGVMTGLF